MTTEKYTVRQACDILGLTIQQVADVTQLSPGTVYAVANPNHSHDTNDETVSLIASALGLRDDELVVPRKVTIRGRRPRTGGSYTKAKDESAGPAICPDCHYALPVVGICGNCT